MEWQDDLISTDIDRLLAYLDTEGKASISQIADDLDLGEDKVKIWARSLEEAGMIEKNYSARHGTMLTIADEEKAKEKLDEVSDETQDEIEQAAGELPEEVEELQEARDRLQALAQSLRDEVNLVERYHKQLEELEAEEQTIREHIKDMDGKIADEEREALETLESIEDDLEALEESNFDIDTFKERKETIKTNLQTLQTISKHLKEINRQEQAEEDQAADEARCPVCGDTFDSVKGRKIHQSQAHTDEEIEAADQETEAGEEDDEGGGSGGLVGKILDVVG